MVRFELVEYSAGLIFILVLCWELYILTGLIPVNTQYSEVFRRSTVAMQILSPTGERIAVSENAADITPAMLEALKQNQHFSATEDITMNLHQIPGGYMVWQTDLSQINQALRELQRLNAELEEEQDLNITDGLAHPLYSICIKLLQDYCLKMCFISILFC